MTFARIVLVMTAVGSLALLLTGCGADTDAGTETTGSSGGSSGTAGLDGDITVFAAASLNATFTELGEQFMAANPGVTVTFNFAGSSDLAAQILSGAPASVFASADTNNMTKVTDAGDAAGEPVDFATNTLQIVTPPGNPAGITSFADLAQEGLTLVICAPQVPCGTAAQQVADAAGVTLSPVSEEQSVADVLAKVTSGEADAGLVYVTDVLNAGDAAEGIEFPEADQAINTYQIAVLAEATAPETAAAFTDFVSSDDGQQVLSDAGFGAP